MKKPNTPSQIPAIVHEEPNNRIYFVKLPQFPFNDEQLATHLRAIPDLSWAALNQLLANRQLLAVSDAASGKTSEALFKASGRIEENAEFTGNLWHLAGKVAKR